MSQLSRRAFYLFIGAIAGLFLGATLGQLLGGIVGSMIDLLGFSASRISGIVVAGGFGLTLGAVIGAGILSLGKIVLSMNEKLFLRILASAGIGLVAGVATGMTLPGMMDFLEFVVFLGSVGLWVGMSAGCYTCVLIALQAGKNDAVPTDKEKKDDQDFAKYLKERTGRK